MSLKPEKSLSQEVAGLDLNDEHDLKKLKLIKRQRKAALTRTIGAANVLIAERNPADVEVKLDILSQQFVNLEFRRNFSINLEELFF